MSSRPWLKIARGIYLAALLAIVVWIVWRRRDELALLLDDARPGFLLVALALGLGNLVINAVMWRTALRALDQTTSFGTVMSATARSVPARYVPGSVWFAVGRAALLRKDGVSTRAVTTVAVLESALSLVVAVGFGAVLLLATGRGPDAGWVVGVACVVLAVAASPPVVNRGLAVVARRRGGDAPHLSWGSHLQLLGVLVGFWIWSATTFVTYLLAFPGVQVGAPAEVAGSFMLAWGVGFLAPFAPQGAGVFEVTVAALLTGGGVAAVAVVVGGFRALMAVRDALAFGVSSLNRASRQPPPTA